MCQALSWGLWRGRGAEGCGGQTSGRQGDQYASFREGGGLGGGVGGVPVMDGVEDGRSTHESNQFGTGSSVMDQVVLHKGWFHGVQTETPWEGRYVGLGS